MIFFLVRVLHDHLPDSLTPQLWDKVAKNAFPPGFQHSLLAHPPRTLKDFPKTIETRAAVFRDREPSNIFRQRVQLQIMLLVPIVLLRLIHLVFCIQQVLCLDFVIVAVQLTTFQQEMHVSIDVLPNIQLRIVHFFTIILKIARTIN